MKMISKTGKYAIFILLMVSIAMALIGCGGGSPGGNDDPGDIVNPSDGGQGTGVVYCGGYVMDGGASKPCYWVSGDMQPVNLDASGLSSADVNGICTYQGNVYCIGNDYTGSGNAPYYWVGSQRYALDNGGSIDAVVQCFSIMGGKVYGGGYAWSDYLTCAPCYWVAEGSSNTRHALSSAGPNGTNQAKVWSCYAYGNRVYFGGTYTAYINDSSSDIPCYWDGQAASNIHPVPLTTAFFYGFLKYIRVSGNQIDSIGFGGDVIAHSSGQTGSMATQDVTQDTTGLNGGSTNAACVINATVYSAGVVYSDNWTVMRPACWVGSTRFDLPLGSGGVSGNVMAMCVRNGIVYCGGYYYDGTQNIPCYWVVNGNNITRHDLAGANGRVKAIFVD